MKNSLRYSVLVSGALAAKASACDLCSIYSAAQAHGDVGKGIFAGVAEQFTHYGTVQRDGRRIDNPAGQRLDSSIAQVFVGYNLNDRFGAQINTPLIHRSFRRATGHGSVDRDSENGVGDVSVLGHANVFMKEDADYTLRFALIGGVKLPSGSTDRLEEEEHHHSHGPGALESAIHGHDLTLGSGSVDGVIGGAFYARRGRAFLNGSVQYAIRTEGDFDYRFGNDLSWFGGPGYMLALEDAFTLSLQANVFGEYKEEDEHRGSAVHDTGVTTVFLGPRLVFTWSDDLSAELSGGVPVVRDNTGYQLMPDYRIYAGLIWHF